MCKKRNVALTLSMALLILTGGMHAQNVTSAASPKFLKQMEGRRKSQHSEIVYSNNFTEEQKEALKKYPRFAARMTGAVVHSDEESDRKWLNRLFEMGLVSPEVAGIEIVEQQAEEPEDIISSLPGLMEDSNEVEAAVMENPSSEGMIPAPPALQIETRPSSDALDSQDSTESLLDQIKGVQLRPTPQAERPETLQDQIKKGIELRPTPQVERPETLQDQIKKGVKLRPTQPVNKPKTFLDEIREGKQLRSVGGNSAE